MRVVILNGCPEGKAFELFEEYLVDLSEGAEAAGHRVCFFQLKKLKIPYCTGCFGCWVKTPGRCVSDDPARDISKAIINSDLVLFASPLIMGFTSAILKNVNDKIICLLHPYIEFVEKECHHKKRYERYPRLGLLLLPERDTDDEDIQIVSDIYRRCALNFRSALAFVRTSETPAKEVIDAIGRV